MRRRYLGVVGAALAAVLLAGCASSAADPQVRPTTPTTPAAPTAATTPAAPVVGPTAATPKASQSNFPDADTLAPPLATTTLKVITLDQLPAEAVATLRLIKDGGPYPYPNDGIMFQNRERRLPRQQAGFYQEYTVPTPGSSDRGARRIVTGADGSLFWTQDHYGSFQEIIAPWQ